MIRAVFFDAVGTLITPQPSAAEVYHSAGLRYGSRLTPEEVARRFRAAFRAEEEIDRQHGWRTDERREEQRWRNIVGRVLDDVTNREECFRELWAHFARAEAWRCADGVSEMLAVLSRASYRLGLASNFDGRLRGVVAGLPGLGPLTRLVVSSEAGWRKPARGFFDEVVRIAGVAPEEVLLVGDDWVNDIEGGRAAGLKVLFVDPGQGPAADRLRSLEELPSLLGT